MIRRMHLWVGVASLAAFVGTGLYMRLALNQLQGQTETVRMLFRSDHIYLLLSAIVNTMLGLYLRQSTTAWRSTLQTAGSLALLAGPPIFLTAFCQEPWLTGLARPWTRPGLFLALGGCLGHLVANAGRDEVD